MVSSSSFDDDTRVDDFAGYVASCFSDGCNLSAGATLRCTSHLNVDSDDDETDGHVTNMLYTFYIVCYVEKYMLHMQTGENMFYHMLGGALTELRVHSSKIYANICVW